MNLDKYRKLKDYQFKRDFSTSQQVSSFVSAYTEDVMPGYTTSLTDSTLKNLNLDTEEGRINAVYISAYNRIKGTI